MLKGLGNPQVNSNYALTGYIQIDDFFIFIISILFILFFLSVTGWYTAYSANEVITTKKLTGCSFSPNSQNPSNAGSCVTQSTSKNF
jgi:hypothetical protein